MARTISWLTSTWRFSNRLVVSDDAHADFPFLVTGSGRLDFYRKH